MRIMSYLFAKPDNGSADWVEWDGEIRPKWLYSAAEAYVRANKLKNGKWTIQYRLGKVGLPLPEVFDKKFSKKEEVTEAIKEFARWAFKNRMHILRAHERSCDD